MTADAPDTLVLLTPEAPYFCVGFHQDLASSLDIAWCRAAGLPIIRRRLGGGAVYLDRNQLFYQLITHRSRAPLAVESLYRRYLDGAVTTLRRLGLEARLSPPNEIEVAGRRIAGTGAGQIEQAVVVVGNILFDFDYRTMARAWPVPTESFRRLAEAGLRSSLTTLARELPEPPTTAEVCRHLVASYAASLGREIVPGELTGHERELLPGTEALLTSPEWVAREGTLRPAGLKISARVTVHHGEHPTDEGMLHTTVRLRDGRIDEFVAQPTNESLAVALRGLDPAAAEARAAIHTHESIGARRDAWFQALSALTDGTGNGHLALPR